MSSRATPAAAAGPISSRARDFTIDNGNHLLLSANRAALALSENYRQRGQARRAGDEAEFAFADLASGERWVLRPNDGRCLGGFFSKRRVPGTHAIDYLSMRRLLHPGRDVRIANSCLRGPAIRSALYDHSFSPR